MRVGTIVHLDAMAFGSGVLDVDGVDWRVYDLLGWDSAAVEAPSGPRLGAHGSMLRGDPRMRARGLVLVGAAGCDTEEQHWRARNRLNATVSRLLGVEGLLVVEELPAHKRALVQAPDGDRPVVITPHGYSFEFEANLVAYDPRKYDVDEDVTLATIAPGGTQITVNVPNTADLDGGIETYPTVSIPGPVTQPIRLTRADGYTVRVDRDLAAGETLVVDFRTKSLTVNGANADSSLNKASGWWVVPPGGVDVTYQLTATAPAGSTATIRSRRAWR